MKSVLVVLLSFWVSLFVTSVWQHMMCFISTQASLVQKLISVSQHERSTDTKVLLLKYIQNKGLIQPSNRSSELHPGSGVVFSGSSTYHSALDSTNQSSNYSPVIEPPGLFTNGREESSTILAYWNETNLRNWEFGKRTCLSLSNSNVIVKLAF